MPATASELTLRTTAETAQILRRNPQTIRRYARERKLRGTKVNGWDWLFTDEAIREFALGGPVEPVATPPRPVRNPKYTK